MIIAFPGFLNTLASSQQDMPTGWDFKRLSEAFLCRVITIDVALQRTFVESFMRLSSFELREVVGTTRC